jgi:hypothetical protein
MVPAVADQAMLLSAAPATVAPKWTGSPTVTTRTGAVIGDTETAFGSRDTLEVTESPAVFVTAKVSFTEFLMGEVV